MVDITPGNPPTTTFDQNIQDVTQSESYGIDLTGEGDRGVVSFRSSGTVRIFDTATLEFIGPVIPMLFEDNEGLEPKQLVITRTIPPTPTPSPSASPEPEQTAAPAAALPNTGGQPASGDSVAWLGLLAAAVAAAAVAGGALAFGRIRR